MAGAVSAELRSVLEHAGHWQERHRVHEPDGAHGGSATAQAYRQPRDHRNQQPADDIRRAQRENRGPQFVKRRETERDHRFPDIEGEPIEADPEAIEDPDLGNRKEVRGAAGGDDRDRYHERAPEHERDLLGPSPACRGPPPTSRLTPEP